MFLTSSRIYRPSHPFCLTGEHSRFSRSPHLDSYSHDRFCCRQQKQRKRLTSCETSFPMGADLEHLSAAATGRRNHWDRCVLTSVRSVRTTVLCLAVILGGAQCARHIHTHIGVVAAQIDVVSCMHINVQCVFVAHGNLSHFHKTQQDICLVKEQGCLVRGLHLDSCRWMHSSAFFPSSEMFQMNRC